MRKIRMAVISCIALAVLGLSGCGNAKAETDTAQSGEEQQTALTDLVYGTISEISEISENTITIEAQPDAENVVIQLSDTTVYKQQNMGGESPQGSDGDGKGGPGGGKPPQKPDGDGENAPGDGEEPPQKPGGDEGSAPADGEEPPEKPGGDEGSAPADGEEPPEKPSGDGEEPPQGSDGSGKGSPGGGKPSQKPGEEANLTEITFEELSEGDMISVTFDEEGNAAEITVLSMDGEPGDMDSGDSGKGMHGSSQPDSYAAVVEYWSDTSVSGGEYTSTGTDENAIHILNGASVWISDSMASRVSSDSRGGDNSSFYGVGAAILATDGTAYIENSTIETDAAGGAGIFAYGDGVIYASDTKIVTQQDTSGGVHVAGGGTLYAWDLDVETNGESAAAIRSDRGSGVMVVDGGSYVSNGTGSPAVYSTADITVHGAALTANGSEAVCIEGLNTLRLYDSDLSGNMSDDKQNDCTWNVILYQSMSGDSEEGNSTFEMVGGTLRAGNGGMFYTTNTESTFVLSGVEIIASDDNEFFLRCTGNDNQRGWGKSGSNGADCLFTAVGQDMEGDIIWDSISTLDFYVTAGSTLTGAVRGDESYAGDGGNGYCSLYIDEDSVWIVTGDSVLSHLYSLGSIVDENGNTVTIQGSDGEVYVEGTGSHTITVDSYEHDVDLSNVSTVTSWSDYEVEAVS